MWGGRIDHAPDLSGARHRDPLCTDNRYRLYCSRYAPCHSAPGMPCDDCHPHAACAWQSLCPVHAGRSRAPNAALHVHLSFARETFAPTTVNRRPGPRSELVFYMPPRRVTPYFSPLYAVECARAVVLYMSAGLIGCACGFCIVHSICFASIRLSTGFGSVFGTYWSMCLLP